MLKTITQVRESFWSFLKETNPELASQRRSRKSQNDYCVDIRVTFIAYAEDLRRDGQISEKLASRVTL